MNLENMVIKVKDKRVDDFLETLPTPIDHYSQKCLGVNYNQITRRDVLKPKRHKGKEVKHKYINFIRHVYMSGLM